jgi:hypothetical protein
MSEKYLLPPMLKDESGETRRAGFEFEFGNLPIVETARALQGALGGELEVISPFEAILSHTTMGRLKVERDADLLKSVRYRGWLETLGVEFSPGSLGHEIETNIDNASRNLIPCEVVTQPIAFRQLGKLDALLHAIDGLGAEGTQHSFIYAFGLHINAAIPDRSTDTLRKYLQAFLLLHAWIVEASSIDITRRFFTKYIDPFPKKYTELALDNGYVPDLHTLISDYLEHNPTRNRALDMLPIFFELDRERVLDALDDDERKLVKGRPAFHYRLPDCRVNEPGWSVAAAWNHWVYVERLAWDDALRAELIEAWRHTGTKRSIIPASAWVLQLTTMLSQKFLSR